MLLSLEWELYIAAAARSRGVPKTTVKDRIGGRVVHGSKPGPMS